VAHDIDSGNVLSLRLAAANLLCPNHVRWVFLLVSSAQAMEMQTMEAELEVSIDSCCTISLTQTYVQELAIVEVAPPVPVAKIFMDPESDEVKELIHVLWTLTSIFIQKLSENTRAVVPTTTQYIVATGKQALALLQSAASVIPVPLLQDAIGVAMKIIGICEVRGILHRKDTRRLTYCGQCNSEV
jgi:hypothetical protein